MEGHPILSPAYELAEGDKDFLNDLLQSMAENIPNDVVEIEKALEHRQLSLLNRSAHHMKSSIMYSNANELKALLEELEHRQQGPAVWDEINALLPELKRLAQELTQLLETELKK